MVLRCFFRAFILLVATSLLACSTTQKQKVVAVSSEGSGTMSSATTKKQITPTPKAVLSLLASAEQEAEKENWEQVRRLLDRAQRMASDEPRIYFSYGEMYLKQGVSNKAITMFQRVMSITDGSSDLANEARAYLNELGVSD